MLFFSLAFAHAFSWGRNDEGQLGIATGEAVGSVYSPATLDATVAAHHGFVQLYANNAAEHARIVKVACGTTHAVALTEANEVFAWGWLSDGVSFFE